ncbi:MAG: hypothetical protein Tsb0024_02390 [Ruegeria sp.]
MPGSEQSGDVCPGLGQLFQQSPTDKPRGTGDKDRAAGKVLPLGLVPGVGAIRQNSIQSKMLSEVSLAQRAGLCYCAGKECWIEAWVLRRAAAESAI